ncbi:MAG: hypothetical protein RR843_12015, partial [Clostridia bacterium]
TLIIIHGAGKDVNGFSKIYVQHAPKVVYSENRPLASVVMVNLARDSAIISKMGKGRLPNGRK